jgi:hypothetical protein
MEHFRYLVLFDHPISDDISILTLLMISIGEGSL